MFLPSPHQKRSGKKSPSGAVIESKKVFSTAQLGPSGLQLSTDEPSTWAAWVYLLSRYKNGVLINHRPEFKMKRMRMHSNHALEIKEVCQEDFGSYTVVLRNRAASLEKRLNITLVVNGTWPWRRLPSAENMTSKNHLLTLNSWGLIIPEWLHLNYYEAKYKKVLKRL